MDKEKRKISCTFTGHRPEKLDEDETHVIEWLKTEIGKAVEEGYTDFITGMARGVDLWAAEEVLRLKEEGAELRLIAASAFKGMEERWARDWQVRYRTVLKKADEVHFISAKPGRRAFFERNEWMVDHASRLIAVYTGAGGGTKMTMEYAGKQGVEVSKYKR